VAFIVPSQTNPRSRTADEKSLADLVESVRRHGVLQPVLVRRRPDVDAAEAPFEIVCGHRRHAAASAAGLRTIPALVRELSDVEALEVQVVENLQRENLHPLEEAEGYARLTRDHGYTVEQLATKLGKSRAYVYGRLALTKLPKVARDVFWKNEMSASLALLIARIPHEGLQKQAAEEILKGDFDGYEGGKPVYGAMTVGEARDLIEEKYMLDMRAAPFSILDAELVPKAGPCSVCPKRTGNVPDLFGDLPKGKDLCTDPPCFRAKAAAAWDRESAAVKSSGTRILTIEQSERALSAGLGGDPQPGGPWLRPGDSSFMRSANGRTHEQMLAGKDHPRAYAARHPKTGKPVLLWKRKEVESLLAGEKGDAKPKASADPQEKLRRDAELSNAIRTRARQLEFKAVGSAALKHSGQKLIDMLLKSVIRDQSDKDIAEALESVGVEKPVKPMNLQPNQRGALLVVFCHDAFFNAETAFDAFGLDLDKIEHAARAEVLAERKAAEKQKPAVETAKPAKAKKPVAKRKGGRK
jgi:ParB/RepB/Spo0J family partition protein